MCFGPSPTAHGIRCLTPVLLVLPLVLALPDYPRAEGVELGERVFSEEGVKPMKDADAKPFAGLAALKEKMEKADYFRPTPLRIYKSTIFSRTLANLGCICR